MTTSRPSVALVTGAASGIGAATVRRLRADGLVVAAVDVTPQPAGDLPDGVQGWTCDVRSPQRCAAVIAAVVDRYGSLDVVVNAAGVVRYGHIDQLPIEDWRFQLDTNLNGTYHVCRAAIPHLRDGGGAIVNVASTQAFATQESVAAYSASKAGIVALTRTLALDHAPDGIRVNAVAPGSVDTGMLRYAAGLLNADDPDAAIAEWGARHPIGRVIRADEVAAAISFLAGDDASAITGTTLMVDGGATAKLST